MLTTLFATTLLILSAGETPQTAAQEAVQDAPAVLAAPAEAAASQTAEADPQLAATTVQTTDVLAAQLPLPTLGPARRLMDVVPTGTVSVWHRRATAETALMDSYGFEVADAVLDARLDEFVLESLQAFGADQGLVEFLASWRNMFQSVSGIVPWRELVQREFLWAQTMTPSFSTDMGIPSMLLACRPEPARLEDLERSVAGFMGSAAAFLGTNGKYEIHSEPSPAGQDTKIYRLSVPATGDIVLLQAAVHNNTLMLGVGEQYFADALHLLRGTGEVRRLNNTSRFEAAFSGLPSDAPSHEYLDVPLFLQGTEDVRTLLAEHPYNTGALQGFLNESFSLVDDIDTIASATHCDGSDVIKETMTRFDADIARHHPMHGVGMAAPASGELFDYIPADVTAFTMRGTVDLVPVWRHMQDEFKANTEWAEDALWAFGILEAAVDLHVERDLLSWMGSEHLSVTMPSRGKYPQPGETDTVILCKLKDPASAKKAIDRAIAIFEAAAPRVFGGTQAFIKDQGWNIKVDATIGPAEGSFRMLNRLEVALGPIPVPQLTFGVMGDLLVMSTSGEALMSCMLVAAEEEDGLSERPLGRELLAQHDLASAELVPMGLQMAQQTQGLQGMSGMLNGFLGGMADDNPGLATGLDCMNDLFGRVIGVLDTVDFLDDSLTVSERREGGLARYERSTTRLLAPQHRPSHAVASSTEAR